MDEWEEGRPGETTFRPEMGGSVRSANHAVTHRFNNRIGKSTIDTSDPIPIDTIEAGSVSMHDNV